MKSLILIGVILFSILVAQAQPIPFAKPRGHYKQLKQLNPKPIEGNLEIDKLKFPFNQATAERRLSLKPYFLSDKIDFEISNPPSNSSEQTRAELNYLLSLQHSRTLEQERSALHMVGIYYNVRTTPADSNYSTYRKNLFHIGRSIGTWFTPDNLPTTANFMAHVWQDASYFIWKYKYKYLRARPYVLEPSLDNLEETNWAAYPSGHAANSYINAFIYSILAPEFTDVFLKDAYDMAHSRELIGVHYPSDSEASRELANQVVKALFKNEKFKKEFQEVKLEWELRAKESFERPIGAIKSEKKKESCAKTCD